MHAEPIYVCDQTDMEAWRLARREGIGASDAPGILALEGAFSNPFSISCSKRGLETDDGDPEPELFKWGRLIEGPALQAFEEETGHQAKISSQMFRRPETDMGFMQATLDGVVTEKGGEVGGAEVKLSIFSAKEWDKYGVPETVLCQAQHQCHVMSWPWVYVIAILDGYRLRWKKVERDDAILGDVIVPAEKDFWQRLQDGEQFDAGIGRPDQSASWLKSLHPDDDGTTIRLEGDHWIEIMDNWRVAAEEEKVEKRLKEKAKNSLVQEIGDATFARLDDGRRISLKTQPRTTKPTTETKTSTFRVLRETK